MRKLLVAAIAFAAFSGVAHASHGINSITHNGIINNGIMTNGLQNNAVTPNALVARETGATQTPVFGDTTVLDVTLPRE